MHKLTAVQQDPHQLLNSPFENLPESRPTPPKRPGNSAQAARLQVPFKAKSSRSQHARANTQTQTHRARERERERDLID